MTKIVLLEKDIKTAQQALTVARKECEDEILDTENKNFIFLDGIKVSNLVIVTMDKEKEKFVFRKCNDEEWKKFYKETFLDNKYKSWYYNSDIDTIPLVIRKYVDN